MATLMVACEDAGDTAVDAIVNKDAGGVTDGGSAGVQVSGGMGGVTDGSGGSGRAGGSVGDMGGVATSSGGSVHAGGSAGAPMTSTGGNAQVDAGAPWYCDEFADLCLCNHTQSNWQIGCKMNYSCCYENKSGSPYCDCQQLSAADCAGFDNPGSTGTRVVPNCN